MIQTAHQNNRASASELDIRTAQADLTRALQTHVEDSRLEADALLCHVLQQPRSYLLAHPEQPLTTTQRTRLDALLRQRLDGQPLAYLTGQREFWSLTFKVTPDVLVPRPETELLVELALQAAPPRGRILDLGTGSGAIALALASELPEAEVFAVDQSPEALKVATENTQRLGLNNVTLRAGNWCEGLPQGEFDLCVSNPPYIAEDDPHLDGDGVRHEPRTALASGPDGLDDIREIIRHAPDCLRTGGMLMLEHGAEQGAAVAALMQAQGLQQVTTHRDYAGNDRVTAGRRA